MNSGPTTSSTEQPIEAFMRDELAQGDAMVSTIGPVLGHLLANPSATLFSEETVARVRGMIHDLAQQFLIVQASAEGSANADEFVAEETDILAGQLSRNEPLVMHCHALALEWEISTRLERDSAIDPILSPMFQRLIASPDDAVSSLAMAAMAAQARFSQQVRRMQLPYTELPVDLFQNALAKWKSFADGIDSIVIDKAESSLRRGFDEKKGRAALFDRLFVKAGEQVQEALSIEEAGTGLFISALSRITGLPRDLVVQCCNEAQFARLAVALRSSGLNPEQIIQQLVQLNPEAALPEGFADLKVEQARQLLNSAGGLESA